MEPSTGTIFIRCVKVDAEYTLEFAGIVWSETWPSIEAAIRRAEQLVVEETKVVVYDTTGRGVVVTTLFPLDRALPGPSTWAERLLGNQRDGSAFAELKTVLATDGVRGAVRYLNSLTPHRFTSLYHFDGPILSNITFYDRQNPDLDSSEDIPVEASYCVFVRDRREKFIVPDASSDQRVKDHPKRGVLKRYCGVPLLDAAGQMFGSICHFDFEPGRVADKEVELLERLAELLRGSFEMRRTGRS